MSGQRGGSTETTSSRWPARPRRWLQRLAWLVVSAIVVAAFWGLELSWGRLLRLPADAVEYFGKLFFHPDWSQFGKALDATIASVQMAWIGTIIGAVCSLPLAFLAAANVAPAWIRHPMRVVFDIIRAVPELVLAIAILAVTGLTPFTGALAIGIHSIGSLGKLSFEAIEAAERGPIEAARSCGGSRSQVVRWGLWTQVQPEILSVWLYRFEINVRAGAILGLIGAGGIGQMLIQNIRYRRWETIGVLMIVVIVVTILIDLLSGMVRARIISGRWPWQRGASARPATPTAGMVA